MFVSANFPPVVGGSAVVYDQMCRLNADKIIALASSTDYRTGAPLEDAARYDQECGFKIYRIPSLRSPKISNKLPWARLGALYHDIRLNISILRTVQGLCAEHAITTVCIGELVYGGWLGVASKHLLGKSFVLYTHGEEITQQGSFVAARLRGFWLRQADLIVAVSWFCANSIRQRYGIAREKLRVIHNGVDTSCLRPSGKPRDLVERHGLEGKKVLGSVGRLVERKGFDAVIKALPAIRDRVPAISYVIVGTGAQAPRLRALASEHGVEDIVTFAGYVRDEDLAGYYALFDVFIMPNRALADGDNEGFGLVFLEANACGVPSVGGLAGGAPEAIHHDRTGLLVNGEEPDAIAESVIALMSDERRRAKLATQGLEFARRSDWSCRAKEFRNVLQSIERKNYGESEADIWKHYQNENKIKYIDLKQPILAICVDTEEEFDWSARFSRENYHVNSLKDIRLFQETCEIYGGRPVYAVTYAVVVNSERRLLSDLVASGRADIGAHLHTWSNPPYHEQVNVFNSYQCNLPPSLEFDKLAVLDEAIRESFGRPATVFKAGRYGLGLSTIANLEKLGFRLDTSPSAGFSFAAEGGPDFSEMTSDPFWLDRACGLLCLPTSGRRVPRGRWQRIVPKGWASRRRFFSVPARLSPETMTFGDMKLLTDLLLEEGPRILLLSVHSSSLTEKGNPYSATKEDVERILADTERYLKYFTERGGRLAGIDEVDRMLRQSAKAAETP